MSENEAETNSAAILAANIPDDMDGVPEQPMSAERRALLPVTKGQLDQVANAVLALATKIDQLHSDTANRAELQSEVGAMPIDLERLEVKLDTLIEFNNLKLPCEPGTKTKFATR